MSRPGCYRNNPLRAARAEPVAARRSLVAEAFHTFGEPSACRLAKSLGVDFETCRGDIERFGRRCEKQ